MLHNWVADVPCRDCYGYSPWVLLHGSDACGMLICYSGDQCPHIHGANYTEAPFLVAYMGCWLQAD